MNPFTAVKGLLKLVSDPRYSQSYYDGEQLKSKWRILTDNFFWLAKNQEVNKFYFLYGLDRKNADPKQVMPYKEFMKIRDGINLRPDGANFNYASLLRDKFVFGQFLSSLKFPSPKNIALLNNKNVTWLDTMKRVPVNDIASDCQININGFCKQLMGSQGVGAFPMQIADGKIGVGGKNISADQLSGMMKGPYLFQELVEQHPEMNVLHAHSVNTLRLITFNRDNNIDVFSGTLRIGTKGNRVDNWNAGGIAVSIDLETGRLRKTGFYKPGRGGTATVHPDSKIVLEGFKIPCFDEAVDLVKKLHTYLYGIHSIGWDIAITPNGPIFIEGNDDWDGSMPMALETGFTSRFKKMYRP